MAEVPDPGLYDPASVALLVDDEGNVRLQGVAFGPAGAISVELPDGAVWTVDHTDPDQIVVYEPADPAVSGDALSRDERVIGFVGGDDAMSLGDELDRRRRGIRAGDEPSDPEELEIVGDDPEVGFRRTARRSIRPGARRRPGPTRVHLPQRRRVLPSAMAELLVLVDLAEDPDLPPLGRIAAGVDLLRRAGTVPGGDLLGPLRDGVVESLAQAAGDVDRDEVASLDPRLVAGLARLLAGVDEVDADLGAALRDLRRWCDELDVTGRVLEPTTVDTGVGVPVAMAAAPFEMGGAHVEGAMDVAFLRLPGPRHTVGGLVVDISVERISPVLVEVRTDDPRAVGRWFVIRRAVGQVHIGHAPVEERELGIYGSVVAVPPDLSDEDCTVLLVDTSELETDGGSPLRLIREAIRAGRDACRAERLDRWSEARAAWNRCAELWTVAGDEQRAALAAENVEYGSPAGLQVGSIADAIAMEGAER